MTSSTGPPYARIWQVVLCIILNITMGELSAASPEMCNRDFHAREWGIVHRPSGAAAASQCGSQPVRHCTGHVHPTFTLEACQPRVTAPNLPFLAIVVRELYHEQPRLLSPILHEFTCCMV